MSKRYPGGVIRKTPATPTQSSASGVWNMTDVTQAQQTNNWPVANVPNPMSRSLRFRQSASAYMNRTPTVASNRRIFTISSWVKRGALGIADAGLFTAWDGTNRFYSRFEADDKLNIYFVTGGSAYDLATSMVFRDPSAWYHIVISVDTTQATNTDRVKIYVNGVQQTYTGTYVPQNTDTMWNYTVQQNIGKKDTSGSYFDGYMAEVNSVDGQALTPTSFGQYDQFGNWTSKKYTGTYGTNGFYLPFSNNSSTGTLGLDFSGNNNTWTTNNFSVTPSYQYTTYTSGSGTYTVPSNVTSIQYLVVAGGGGGSSWGGGGGAGGLLQGTMAVTPGQTIAYSVGAGGAGSLAAGSNGTSGSNSTFGSLTAIGGGGGTANTTVQNGGSGGGSAFGSSGGPGTSVGLGTTGQGSNGGLSSTSAPYQSGGGGAGAVGGNPGGGNPGGYAGSGGAGLTWINGSTYAGGGGGGGAVNAGGAWSAGSGGSGGGGAGGTSGVGTSGTANTGGGGGASGRNTNTFYDAGAGGSGVIIIANATGNSTYDSMTDVPTQWTPYNVTGDVGGIVRGNYCTMNPLFVPTGGTTYFALTNGNLTMTGTGGTNSGDTIGTMSSATGKFYYEFTITASSGGNTVFGACDINQLMATTTYSYIGYLSKSYSYRDNGNKQSNNIQTAYGSSFGVGDIISVALDCDNGAIYFAKNGTWQASGVPTSGASKTNAAYTWTGGSQTMVMQCEVYQTTCSFGFNAGQMPFAYAPPSGYTSFCTTSLPTPTIQQGNLVMDATLYTGTSATQVITNTAGFKPDFAWFKSRNAANHNILIDSVRGVDKDLYSSLTDAEATVTDRLLSFNSNGVTVGVDTGRGVNYAGQTQVLWQWQAGQGTTSSNTSGTITSTVSVNATAGFSIVTYTGTGSPGTVGHGLGVAPAMMIVKSRNATQYWIVQHQSLTSITRNLYLQLTDSEQNDAQFTAKSSTTVTVNGGSVTGSGTNYVMYCWSEVAGFSKFGSYVGNASTDGPFIYCGFRPKFIMTKASSTGSIWGMWDSSRNTYNAAGNVLQAQASDAEISPYNIDILSNGFKIRDTNSNWNGSGQTFIFMAFAEYPFKSALAR